MARPTWTEYSKSWRERNPERYRENELRRYLAKRNVKNPRVFASEPSPFTYPPRQKASVVITPQPEPFVVLFE